MVPYVPIERHALIGDRRCAALVAADGTIDWFCAPRYDSDPIFDAILDAGGGGRCRFAPRASVLGRQRYSGVAPIAETEIAVGGARVVVTDAMARPEHPRATAPSRTTILRRMIAHGGAVDCVLDVRARDERRLDLWSTHAPPVAGRHLFTLRDGEEAWAIVETERQPWTVERAREALDEVRRWWELRASRFAFDGRRRDRLLRSAVTIELLCDATSGSSIAAPTTSLPERIGGDWNADYRLSWIRDASLSAATLARAGDHDAAIRYFEWLTRVRPDEDGGFQIVYRSDGSAAPRQIERHDLHGYRGSCPVRFGNHAYEQRQLGIEGFVADAARVHLQCGGRWSEELFAPVERGADYTASHWRDDDNGIWELSKKRAHLSSRVMSWVALQRTVDIAPRHERAPAWSDAAAAVREEVIERGWSARRRSFVHAIGDDALDASALLVPIMGLLPPRDPRVRATLETIERDLSIDGWIHRFDPHEVQPPDAIAMGEFEGAFVLCNAWLASAWALAGEPDRGEQVLERIDAAAGDLGLLPEAIDARSGAFRGNFPLLFSHAEYVRAVLEVDEAQR